MELKECLKIKKTFITTTVMNEIVMPEIPKMQRWNLKGMYKFKPSK
jgi:hypothetical protein